MNDKLRQTKALPVSLLLNGRFCLVVGGGKVALRKVGHLLDAGAQVTVIAPELSNEFPSLEVTHIQRPVEADDVNGFALVFSATNNRHVNRQVLEACREKNILCSCVDGHWAESDFITPAIARHGNLTLTVSTGGQSCRQAKMVKDSLAKHLEMVETAELIVVGTDHHHLSLKEREPFHLTGDRLIRAGFMLTHLWGIHEFMLFNTCNRVELIAVVSAETAGSGILRHALGFDRLIGDQLYVRRGVVAHEHLCLAASGMLSQTLGETHVAAQLKEALSSAQEAGWAGSMMQEWVSVALHISKHIQTEIAPDLHAEEIETLALRYLENRSSNLAEKTLLILGAGRVGQGLVSESFPRVGKVIWCYHKNRPDVSKQWKNITLCTFNEMKDWMSEADIIISATEAPGYILHSGHAPFFNQEKQIMLIDLGMPRNIDPALKELSGDLQLVDLDGLKHGDRSESIGMDQILGKCRALIGEHQEQYERIINSFQGGNA